MDDLNLRCVAPVGNLCGEGATWCAAEQALYWTDVNRFLVHRLTVATGAVESWFFDEPCVALSLTDRPGTLLLGIGSRLLLWQPWGDVRTPHGFALERWPAARLNEGRAGPGGEFWIGSMSNNVGPDGGHVELEGARGQLFRLIDGQAPRMFKDGIVISNTMCFSPDRRHLYFGDTVPNVIWRHDYDAATRSISNETPFFAGFDRGRPDGSAIDAEGCLWNTRFGGKCLVRVAPDGSIDRIVELPVSNPTTCAFGGPDLRTLYITSASVYLDGHERLAGSLFALDAPAPGLPENRYRLAG
ncbi:SMP-30/gluconolactonase/LRE family protein [Sandaracinobacteroides saxicola]|uniref:SMP-30/gluconolactonase/LRE family protein n=1 Tax=Sandaracinobacteroides saxicola TaxID=2759707 RepID=A0A7G5IG36_9SPHN|nr:SMP-30/gluconolactonase/LRE family protein [Sandaracinobacteroides saxicola]QMW22328.1 SMP-30/gluconolactonase/LRE family protein [Sandaracinobacteroides saxicola]